MSDRSRFRWVALPAVVLLAAQSWCASSVAPSTDGDSGRSITNDASSVDGDSGPSSEVAPPRLMAPLSTATVTQRRPTLRWSLPDGSDGAHVQLCRDRACTMEFAHFDAVDSVAPAADLPPGVVFWRAVGRRGQARGTRPSATWEFFVGPRSSPGPDTSWGSTLDVNGDGFADVAVGASAHADYAGEVKVFSGSAAGVVAASPVVLARAMVVSFGLTVATAGDVDGDGFGDLVVGSTAAGAFVYLGGPGGVSATRVVPLADAAGVTGAGDFDGDGYGDLVMTTADGAVRVVPGGPNGPSGASTLLGSGVAASSAGDIDGDGSGDIAVAAAGQIGVYFGSRGGGARAPAVVVPDADLAAVGASISFVGDVDGDGRGDVAIVPEEHGSVQLLRGSSVASRVAPQIVRPASAAAGRVSVAGAGDVDADGFADVLIGDPQVEMGVGAVTIVLGSRAGLDMARASTRRGLDGPYGEFGAALDSPGDVNGDGFSDVVIGATTNQETAGRAYVYLGSALGLSAMPATMMSGDNVADQFGVSVARAEQRGVHLTRVVLSGAPAGLPARCTRARAQKRRMARRHVELEPTPRDRALGSTRR